MTRPPICDYEGSEYQSTFWGHGGREYEDRAEAIALRRLLPRSGRLLLEVGAGAGRNTQRYAGFACIVLLDYSRTQLEQAQQRLADSANVRQDGLPRYVYVAADAYRLPFADGLFDAATMIRVLHHMADAPRVLAGIAGVLRPGGCFILEFANKLNLKAVLRYLLRRQAWNPFSPEPVEFARLNFDFHPGTVRGWLTERGLVIERTLTVSHFRLGLFKRLVPPGLLAFLDSLFQPSGALFQLTPSVFVRARRVGRRIHSSNTEGSRSPAPARVVDFFQCPDCGHAPLAQRGDRITCPSCALEWAYQDGIYDFRNPI